MGHDYVENYITAIDNPLPSIKESFMQELELLKKNSNFDSIVLDVGCGAGRPGDSLSSFVKKIVSVDNDPKMIFLAKERCSFIKNMEILEEDALNLKFKDESFDLVYSTYNLLGSLKKEERQKVVCEMKRVTKKGGRMINLTWKDDKKTTDFLKKYYPSIKIDVISADNSRTVTSKGVFERISKEELLGYYVSVGIKKVVFEDVGSVWIAIIGTK